MEELEAGLGVGNIFNWKYVVAVLGFGKYLTIEDVEAVLGSVKIFNCSRDERLVWLQEDI